jgi:hypothetical protein
MSKSDAKQASKNLNYQDDVNAALDRKHDLNATAFDDEKADEDSEDITTESANYVKAAVHKVVHFISQNFLLFLIVCL